MMQAVLTGVLTHSEHFTLWAVVAVQQGKGMVEMTPVHFICLNKPILMNLLHCLPIQIQDENCEPNAD